LHDTWAFTGGCHYNGDCTGFQRECGSCPQLNSIDDNDMSRALMRRKAATFRGLDLTIVTPSRWMAGLAASSSLFAGRRIEVIPNGLDTEAFKPIDRRAARAYLGVDDERPVILFGAHWLPDPRKGGDLLCKALASYGGPCTLLTFGEGQLPLEDAGNVQLRSLGMLNDAAGLALAYSAADLFACPSREDNLPNTVAEAMACGTPCVAFAANGLPDMITHGVDGWLAQAFNPEDLAAGIRWIATHPKPEELRRAAREKALRDYSLDVMTDRYTALYNELLRDKPLS
jgi:glycosyltransferase involved in cell wall biosynthesis